MKKMYPDSNVHYVHHTIFVDNQLPEKKPLLQPYSRTPTNNTFNTEYQLRYKLDETGIPDF